MMFLLLIKCLKNICEIIHLLFKLKRKIKMSKKKTKIGSIFFVDQKTPRTTLSPIWYKQVIKNLLRHNPQQRAGIEYLKSHPFFTKKFDWNKIFDVPPPFLPEPQSNEDIAYFEIRNARRGIVMSPGPPSMLKR